VFTAKNAFIDQHKLVIVRLSDHWRLREPDPLAAGLAQAMGWTKYLVAGDARRYDVPALTVDALTTALEKNLGARGGIRVVGDAKTSVHRIGLLSDRRRKNRSRCCCPRSTPSSPAVREWESVIRARPGRRRPQKAWSRRSQGPGPGMQVCADWLKTVIPGLPVRHIAAGDPYWRPAR
jgi:hypothetical protein